MKRVLTIAMAFLFSCCMALAQNTGGDKSMGSSNSAQDNTTQTKSNKKVAKAEKKEAKAAEKGKAMRLTGWVKNENGKTVFVNDKDKQAWNISNPDAVTGHEGHHVKVKAKLNEADHSVTIQSLKMMRKGKQAHNEKTGS